MAYENLNTDPSNPRNPGITKSGYQPPEKPSKKTISSFTINKASKLLSVNGETRRLKVRGFPSSVFSLTAKDSSGCSILNEIIENHIIPENGEYMTDIYFPPILAINGPSKTKETYNITITPTADVFLDETVNPNVYLEQINKPTITFTREKVNTEMVVAGSIITKSGPPRTWTEGIYNYSNTELEWTITEHESYTDGFWYVKPNANFNDNISSSTAITKVVDRGGETGITRNYLLKPLTNRTNTTVESDDVITGDLEAGMSFKAKVEKTKTVRASIDSKGEELDYQKCVGRKTTKFKLSDTNDLTEGMIVGGNGIFDTEIVSVDCKETVTLSQPHEIRRNTSLTFEKNFTGGINDVKKDHNGKAPIEISPPLDIPNGTVLEFDDNKTSVMGKMNSTGSGTNSVVLTIDVGVRRFGEKDVTYTLDLDKIVTRTPNAKDINISIIKNTAYTIEMATTDTDDNATSKTATVVNGPRNGSVGAYNTSSDSFTYTPNNGFVGEDSFSFTKSDGTNSSDEKIVTITVN